MAAGSRPASPPTRVAAPPARFPLPDRPSRGATRRGSVVGHGPC
jgi:hypothetical protein